MKAAENQRLKEGGGVGAGIEHLSVLSAWMKESFKEKNTRADSY